MLAAAIFKYSCVFVFVADIGRADVSQVTQGGEKGLDQKCLGHAEEDTVRSYQ